MSTWDEGLQDWRRARELADLSADERAWINGHYPEQLDVTTHGQHLVEDDEPRPDGTPNVSPTWFIVVFSLAVIGCCASALATLIMWLAGVFS